MKQMKIKHLKALLSGLKGVTDETNVKIACDEEWNVVFKIVNIEKDIDGSIVLYGLSGSEERL